MADIIEIRKLLDTGTMQTAHLKGAKNKSPTYYIPVYKEQIWQTWRGATPPSSSPRFYWRQSTVTRGIAHTAEIDVIKSVFNSVVSDNANNGYQRFLSRYTSTSRWEYMWINDALFTDEIIASYNLQPFVVPSLNSFRILMRICKTIYGLKNTSALSKRKLDDILSAGDYR